ncbi:MAG TPA: hypothetical protein VFS09_02110 [Candidatus Eisenbacteria bacterium]|nr:hypothetical protein [Candidatus Eisenbacteria bacterium]
MRAFVRAAIAFLAPLVAGAGLATAAFAQQESGSTSGALPQGANLLNPAVSVIGWFQGEAGDRIQEEGTSAFSLKEAELGLQANVDPYSRADFFVSMSPSEGLDVEEGYLTLLALPAGLSAKLGKFRGNFGKFNRTHPPETSFADRPLAAERFFGEEGLSAEGVSASWLIPWLPFYANLDAEATTTPDLGGTPAAFAPYRGQDLLYLGRLSTFFDLSEASNIALGGSYANGANGSARADSSSDPEAMRARVVGADLTFRWKNPRRSIYRSLIAQVEWMERTAETLGGPDVTRTGGFAWADFQFARRWRLGGRYDWSDNLDASEAKPATGVLGFLTFNPSEFASMSGQVSRRSLEGGTKETQVYFKTTFNIGPHGAHPF